MKELAFLSLKHYAAWQLLCGWDNDVKAWGVIKVSNHLQGKSSFFQITNTGI